MKFVLCLVLTLCVGVLPACADCTFTVQFENSLSEKVFYTLDWVDHPFEYPKPFNLAGGELHPGQSWRLKTPILCGEYLVKWMCKDLYVERGFVHKKHHDPVRVLTPDGR